MPWFTSKIRLACLIESRGLGRYMIPFTSLRAKTLAVLSLWLFNWDMAWSGDIQMRRNKWFDGS